MKKVNTDYKTNLKNLDLTFQPTGSAFKFRVDRLQELLIPFIQSKNSVNKKENHDSCHVTSRYRGTGGAHSLLWNLICENRKLRLWQPAKDFMQIMGNLNLIVQFSAFVSCIAFQNHHQETKIWACELQLFCNWNVITTDKWIACDVDKNF